MSVRSILRGKPAQRILTISPEASVAEASEMLSANKIGALVVSRTGSDLAGILSERDIVRELGRQGAPCLDLTVDSMMTKTVTTVHPDETALGALSKMSGGRFRHLPVMENERMVGVISIGDVVKYRMDEMARENSALTDMIVGHG